MSEQISLIGSTSAAAESLVAAEVSGIVGTFNVKEGDFVKKGQLLARLKDKELELRVKGAVATREKTRANLENAVRELARSKKLKASNTIADSKYEEALYKQQALEQALLESEAEIEYLRYQIKQKNDFGAVRWLCRPGAHPNRGVGQCRWPGCHPARPGPHSNHRRCAGTLCCDAESRG